MFKSVSACGEEPGLFKSTNHVHLGSRFVYSIAKKQKEKLVPTLTPY